MDNISEVTSDLLEDNFIKVKKNLFFSKTEVSNKEYNLFLLEAGINTINSINNSGWTEGDEFRYSFFKPYQDFYHSHFKYENHPVVNIYQEGATLYCNWLSEKYNNLDSPFKGKIEIRLPSIEEWQAFNRKSGKIVLEKERLQFNPLPKDEKFDSFNITPQNIDENDFQPSSDFFQYLMSDEAVSVFTTWPVNYYPEDSPTIKHLLGNVSEWTAEKNIAIGGNWMTIDRNKISDTLHEENYSPKIGFRVVLEIID